MGRFVEELVLQEVPEPLPWSGWKSAKEADRYELIRKVKAQNEEALYDAIQADYRYDTVMDAIDKIEGIVDKVMNGIMQIDAHNKKPNMYITVNADGASEDEIKKAVILGITEAIDHCVEQLKTGDSRPIDVMREVNPDFENLKDQKGKTFVL